VDATKLKSGYAKLVRTNSTLADEALENKANYDKLWEDAAELQHGYDGLATANQQLAEDAVGNKASYDRLQVPVPGLHESVGLKERSEQAAMP
jgi:hypothetical protein